MKSRGKAIMQALGIGVGALLIGFFVGYFFIFASLETPANSADGQAGLTEFLRLLYSAGLAGVSGIVAGSIAMWRLWARTTN
jgi:hypothetical protein